MIDIHVHILPGVDDGPRSQEEMILMAKQAVHNGITTVVATPHHRNGLYENPPETILQSLCETNTILQQQEIPLTILPGMEIRLYSDLINDLQKNQLIAFNQQNRHILVELPHDHVPIYMERFIFELRLVGYVPIIAHPERNIHIRTNPNLLYRFIEMGAMAQMTAASLTGDMGKNVQKSAWDMINHQLIQFIASDAHNVGKRGFILREAYEVIEHRLGREYVQHYKESTQNIIDGRDCLVLPPTKITKKFLGFFRPFT
ncbi:tyrosine-protein phosphatase [Brevibacillus daliensis]|uniref:tyrosine-protein phosphatase n=1 Tax=Brevibacillus daliensis TaxID=2892995 RepID=UPI001E584C52|nr:CpsB/CapC family capsule biosynthesis tyrosine phosphatase [Brevibacillus daliensis]